MNKTNILLSANLNSGTRRQKIVTKSNIFISNVSCVNKFCEEKWEKWLETDRWGCSLVVLSDEVKWKQRPEWRGGACCLGYLKGTCSQAKCQGLEVRLCLVFLRSSEEASGFGLEWVQRSSAGGDRGAIVTAVQTKLRRPKIRTLVFILIEGLK